jgi:formyltetrahydrofolate synthetase
MKKLTPEEIAMDSRPPMTLGEKRCHINFNPSAHDKIGKFKRMMADAIDFCEKETQESLLKDEEWHEQQRCFRIANEHLETAQMYAVKGIAKGLNK